MTDVHDLRTRIGLFVATCGYLGFAPVAPGTFGSAAGLAAYYLLDLTGSAAIYGLVTAGLFALGIWSVATRPTPEPICGLGVMADDGMAAIYAHLLMRGLLWLAPAWFAA